nr:RagB/SusD family nutrient uptake outer membrane protein [Pedobacter panaciterrae]
MSKSKYIKKIKRLFFLTILLANYSCTDSFLDVQPVESVSNSSVIVDAATAQTAINGVYSQLQNRLYYGGDGYAATAYLSSGDHIWVGTLNYYNAFPSHTYRADNTLLNNVWSQIFTVINGANNVIDKVNSLPEAKISAVLKNQYVGEAYFIRALAYFDLARAWGNVPIVLKATVSPNDFAGVKQSNQKQVYQQVLRDLDVAEGLLPAAVNRNRATKKTVYALKSRVHLYNEDWQKAIDYSSLIIADSNYELVSWATILGNLNTKESIFELAFATADQSAHFGSWSSKDYRNQFAPGPTIYADLQNAAIGGDRKSLIEDNSSQAIRNYFVQKLYWRATGENPAYILRLSEQYLIRAEAYLKIPGPNADLALKDLNAVKGRAHATIESISDPALLLSAIAKERRLEFALEPHRWFDLTRTKKAGEVLGVTDSNLWIFPIPFNDLEVDDDLVQNPGYN